MQASTSNQNALLQQISQLEFALIEITLYLDNHPQDSGAISRFSTLSDEYHSLYDEYVAAYGPLRASDPPRGNTWLWSEQNFPWDV